VNKRNIALTRTAAIRKRIGIDSPAAMERRLDRIAAMPDPDAEAGATAAPSSVAHVATPTPNKDGKFPIIVQQTVTAEGVEHGQLLIPGLGQGSLGVNFTEPDFDASRTLPAMLRRLADFLASDEPGLPFESPHDGRTHYLTRAGAALVVGVMSARTKGPVAPRASKDSKIVLVGPDGGLLRA
jgi:hypothetical protein